ncbi:Rne/Rng family ribonuclease [bacterium]|nr:Rne/Rng family ribonuclease [bacterium]
MGAQILISQSFRETRVARIENDKLVEFFVERRKEQNLVGNIYKGRVNRVLPGMQAAFVEIGLPKAGFLYAGNVQDNSRETIAHDELEEPSENHRQVEPRKISELVHEGESLLVQVLKEPMGTKGARLTGHISIPGRFLVYLPHSQHLGVSRRIEEESERARLKGIVDKHRPKQGGFIIRTVAEGARDKHIKDDMDYLVRSWGSIKKAADKIKKPGVAYSDLDLASKIIRDRVGDDVERIVVDDLELYKKITKFVQTFLPRFKKRIEIHDKDKALFDLYGIETEIARALERKVWLKSGGYIIIDETEALTTIDVNSGRFVGNRHLEDTILQTNLEAVKETAYQIRLRNLGGIIVLDFIDMQKQQNRERVHEMLIEELEKDPVKSNVLPISDLGLIEMTRKRTQESLRKKLMSSCTYCNGKGSVKSNETLAAQLIRACLKEADMDGHQSPILIVYCNPHLAEYFAEEDREAVEYIEKQSKAELVIKADPNLHLEDYEIFCKDA